MIKKYIIVADDSIKGFDKEIARLEREWGAEEIEPSEDCISRQAVLDNAYAYGYGLEPEGYCVNVEDIQALPPVTPQPNKSEILTGWIPVSERLPEKTGKYLVTVKNGNVYAGVFDEYSGKFQCAATAWMPLPEPYQSND